MTVSAPPLTVSSSSSSTPKTTAIDVQNLTHVFPPAAKGGAPRPALTGLSFTVESGEIFGLLGPNGGGKTTLFRILSTLRRATGGTASLFGVDVAEDPSAVRRKIGVVFQNPSLDKKLTVRENLTHQGHLYGIKGPDLARRVEELLSHFALADRSLDRAETLSGGLLRRLEIAKGLIHDPELLLLDEPSTGLDPGARRDLWDYLLSLKEGGMTVLVTTHLLEEAEHCDRILILNQGRRVALGTPASLKAQIGGDVITIQTRHAQDLAQKIRASFDLAAREVDGALRLEKSGGHTFIPELVEAFPGMIDSVTVGKPTLEDVFIRLTGHRLWREREEDVHGG